MENTSRILTVIGIVVLLFATIVWQNTEIVKLRSQSNPDIDSLQTELFTKQTELGRYEVALDILKEKDSVAANKFKHILDTQTE